MPVVGTGMGRKGQLEEPRKLNDIVDVTKKHLKLANLRLVTANDKVQLVPYIECMAYKLWRCSILKN